MSGKYHGAVDTFTETQSLETYMWHLQQCFFPFFVSLGSANACVTIHKWHKPLLHVLLNLPWDLVGTGWDRRRISLNIPSPVSSFAVCVPWPEWLSPAIRKKHSLDLFVHCVPQSQVPDLTLVSSPILEAFQNGNISHHIPKVCWVTHLPESPCLCFASLISN